jgi:protoporphyrin/coproporphyrin ferrochelatase
MKNKKAIILLNLGGPLDSKDIYLFLYNLFSDPLIFSLLKNEYVRNFVASIVSKRRVKNVEKIYKCIGNGSTLLINTLLQASMLETSFNGEARVFIAMRYCFPRVKDCIKKVVKLGITKVSLLPLYPQFSTATTLSSVLEFTGSKEVKNGGISVCSKVGCYPSNKVFIQNILKDLLRIIKNKPNSKIIFSAHGLPLSIVKNGDPYPDHVKKTVFTIMKSLIMVFKNVDWMISYQSRVGPLKWLKPSTEEQIMKFSKSDAPLLIVPISFVSEHSETLFELDIEYKEIATNNSSQGFERTSTSGIDPSFILSLKNILLEKKTDMDCIKSKCYCACN